MVKKMDKEGNKKMDTEEKEDNKKVRESQSKCQ